MESADSAVQPLQESGVKKRNIHMKRRNFLRTFLLGSILFLFGKKVRAEKKPGNHLTMAMFWRRIG
jgi:hypothetical protein